MLNDMQQNAPPCRRMQDLEESMSKTFAQQSRKAVRCAIHKGPFGGPLQSAVLHLPLGLNVARESSAVLGIPARRLRASYDEAYEPLRVSDMFLTRCCYQCRLCQQIYYFQRTFRSERKVARHKQERNNPTVIKKSLENLFVKLNKAVNLLPNLASPSVSFPHG